MSEEMEMTDFNLPAGTFYADISGAQRRAILYAIKKGLELGNSCQWIAEEFREGKSIEKITQDERISDCFNGSRKTLYAAVRFALQGYNGNISFSKIGEYSGLISKDEYLSLVQQHNSQSTTEWNKQMQELGVGITALTREQRQEIGRRSGLKQLENRIGIHAQTLEERREAVRLALIAQGKIPWKDDETKCCYELSLQDIFRKETRTNWQGIAVIVNKEYHDGKEVRNNRAVAKAAKRWEQNHMESLEDEQVNSLLEIYVRGNQDAG